MLKRTHIRVAGEILDTVQSNIDWKVNKLAYLFGSIAPDLNCVFPTHTLNNTSKRFKNRLKRMDKHRYRIVKSFTLGVITHYICDYFCFAHNLEKNVPKHAVYERFMRRHMQEHEEVLKICGEDIINQWEFIKEHTLEEMAGRKNNDVNDIIGSITNKGIDHINYIIDMVDSMHKEYISKTTDIDILNWFNSNMKVEIDIEYARFMCEKIALLILNPGLEIVSLSKI